MKQARHTISILIFLIALSIIPLHAQNVLPVPSVLVESAPEQPVAGSSWTLTLIINHPYPNEVTVFPPEFAESLVLEQTHIVARIVESGGRQNRWTAAEYRFMLNKAETILFDPFTVVTPGGSVQTDAITLAVLRADATVVLPKPKLAWEGSTTGIHTGKAAAVNLVVSGWDSHFLLPQPQFFMPELVDGAILEAQELSDAEGESLVALRLRIIPLKPGAFVLPARTLVSQNISFAIPQLRITVAAAPAAALPIALLMEDQTEARAVSPPLPMQFKDFAPLPVLKGISKWRYQTALSIFRDSYEDACRLVEELWDNGHYVEALALLRRRERHAFAGVLYTHIRRQAEQALAVNLSGTEPPRKIFQAPWRTYRYGVLRETPFRRIPDFSGDSPGEFREGQPARISMMKKNAPEQGFLSTAWVWAETASYSGWIPEERVIYY